MNIKFSARAFPNMPPQSRSQNRPYNNRNSSIHVENAEEKLLLWESFRQEESVRCGELWIGGTEEVLPKSREESFAFHCIDEDVSSPSWSPLLLELGRDLVMTPTDCSSEVEDLSVVETQDIWDSCTLLNREDEMQAVLITPEQTRQVKSPFGGDYCPMPCLEMSSSTQSMKDSDSYLDTALSKHQSEEKKSEQSKLVPEKQQSIGRKTPCVEGGEDSPTACDGRSADTNSSSFCVSDARIATETSTRNNLSEPRAEDVLCGRGSLQLYHNKHFVDLCKRYEKQYCGTKKRGSLGKLRFVDEIIQIVNENGGTFLQPVASGKGSVSWEEAPYRKVKDKVCHCMRDIGKRHENARQ